MKILQIDARRERLSDRRCVSETRLLVRVPAGREMPDANEVRECIYGSHSLSRGGLDFSECALRFERRELDYDGAELMLVPDYTVNGLECWVVRDTAGS